MSLILCTYELASGTVGAAIANPTWTSVPLNTEVIDTGGVCVLNANGSMTLSAGTYRVRGFVTLTGGVTTGTIYGYSGRWRNLTSGTTVSTVLGTTTRVYGDSTPANRQTGKMLFLGRFTTAGALDFVPQVLLQGAGNTGTFGFPAINGVNEVYGEFELVKE